MWHLGGGVSRESLLFAYQGGGGLPWCSQAPKCVCVYDLYCMFSVHHDVTGHLEHH